MCAKCDELDHKIRNYQRIAQFGDRPLIEIVARSVADLEAEKLALHSKQKK